MLEVDELVVGYGTAQVVDRLSFRAEIDDGLALLGRNGAGKSTTLNAIMGLLKPWSGDIRLDGTSLIGLPVDQIARLGIGYVPEDRRIFADLSVTENLLTGIKANREGKTFWNQNRAFELFPEIARRRDAIAGSLSGGERQMLAIARALVGNPRFLLLDEPLAGLNQSEAKGLADLIQSLNRDGQTILLIEHNLREVMRICPLLYVQDNGRPLAFGPAKEVMQMPDVRSAYLGKAR